MWLTVRHFKSTQDAITAVREDGRKLWVTDLSQEAKALDYNSSIKVPARFALVIGRETDGVSEEMLKAADLRVYLPMHGFADSLNLSVATALVIQKLFIMAPEMVGDFPASTKKRLRKKWYNQVARTAAQKERYQAYINNPPTVFQDLRRPNALRKSFVRKKVFRKTDIVPEKGSSST
mmetsp:Transcript_25640/g.41170  ORF Transcript_25640/g.41170 Transcript_25640/m.41170 type:complete len:178 (-) Transcript_25640:304-837(-)